MDEVERLKDELEQLWGESEPHASGDICLNCNRLATVEGFPWCDQCFLEEQGKYLAAESEMWKAKTERLQVEAEGLRRWLAEGKTSLTEGRADLDAVDAALGDFYCPVLDPETDEPCGSFYKDHGAHLAMDEIERLRAALTEANAENARLAGEYQAAADEVCAALGVEWTKSYCYPTVAVEATGRLRARSKLVTLELAELLVILANAADNTKSLGFAQLTYIARSTASRIREILDA